MPARKPRPDETPQFERFLETARQVGADETDKALERALDAIAQKRRQSATSTPSMPAVKGEG